MKDTKAGKTIWLSPLVSDKDFDIAFRDDHVHISVGPKYQINPQQREEFWGAIIAASEKHNSKRILIEGYRPKDALTTNDVIEAGKLASSRPNIWIAFCLDKLFPAEQRELFEVVVASRCVRAKFFTNRQKALHWLRTNAPA